MLVVASLLAETIDRRFGRAAVWCLVAAVFSWLGLMHSASIRWAAQPEYAAGWLAAAVIVYSARWWDACGQPLLRAVSADAVPGLSALGVFGQFDLQVRLARDGRSGLSRTSSRSAAIVSSSLPNAWYAVAMFAYASGLVRVDLERLACGVNAILISFEPGSRPRKGRDSC